MRLPLTALLLLAVTACGLAATPTPSPTPATLTQVRLAMGFFPDVQFAPFYVAAEEGYFAEQGIEVEFVTMFENDAVPLLGTDELQFANVSAEQVIQARAQGLPVTYVMKWWEQYPIAVVSRSSQGIRTPADLVGHKVGTPALWGASYVGWRALLKSQRIDEGQVQLETIGFTQAEAIAAGQVDAAIVYANNEPVKLRAAGEEVNVIYVSDYVQLASNGLASNEKTIAERPDLVQGMVAAILKGLADTTADPDRAFEISKKYVETLATADAATAATARKVLAASIDMWQTPAPGVTERGKWEAMQATLLEMGLISSPINLDEAFTNQFVEP